MRKETRELIEEKLKSWDFCKKRLLICVAPKGSMENCIVFPYLDLDAYIRIIIYTKENDGQISCKVNESILKQWGINRNELFDAAVGNSHTQYRIHTLSDLFRIPTPIEQVVVRVKNDLNGAGAIMFTDTILQDIANFFDSDLIIFPSSVHEILCMSTHDIDLKSASALVKEVNEENVKEEDRLSDHAYLYHRSSKTISW